MPRTLHRVQIPGLGYRGIRPRYGGFRQQEYAMDHKNKVKYFNTSKGQVVRTFTMENIIFQDRDQKIVHGPLLRPEPIETVGTRGSSG